ncbi:MAG: hypothetical protein Fur0044_19570 [Anaerolineae bacterium]|nr:aminoglycoside phosphotransferase family protein [Anaerolineales bacterium]MCQ3975651.1 hypothetical protein [Anaerolineae bacterium]
MSLTLEIPQDKTLPQLAAALDIAAMRSIFEQALFAGIAPGGEAALSTGRFQIRACQIERIKYKPGQNCLICYQLTIHDTLTQQDSDQILCGRIYERGSGYAHFIKARTPSLVTPKFGPPLLYLPGLEMVVWVFPNDRKLDALPKLMDQTYLQQEVLSEVVAANFGNQWQITELAQRLVHYVPEHTCTSRVQLQLGQKQTGEKLSLVLYGKTYYNRAGEETYQLMEQLWVSKRRQEGRLRLAQPLAYQPHLKMLWQVELPGQTLLAQDLSSPPFLNLLSRAAVALAEFHQTQVACAKSSHLSDWLTKLQEMKQLLRQVRPAGQKKLDILVERLLDQAEQLGPQPVATLHGDLHLKNFFVEGEQVALIDLDNLCHGSPWQDVGSFSAGLLYWGLFMAMPTPLIWQFIDAFCQQYEQNVPWPMSRFALNWYTAAALINERAFRCVTRLKSGRLDLLDDLIDLADSISAEQLPFYLVAE